MNDRDPRLSELIHDAVADVEPREALASIRARTQEAPVKATTWLYTTGGAVLAVAATVGAFAVLGPNDPATSSDPAPADQPTPSQAVQEPSPEPTPDQATEAASPTPSESPTPDETEQLTAAAYYVGDGPDGPRLFREFRKAPGTDPLDAAIAALTSTPSDPDYRTWWPSGSIQGATYDGDVVSVVLADDFPDLIEGDVPRDQAAMAIEQVIFTVQGAVQERAPVQFRFRGNPVNEVYGRSTSEPLANGPLLKTLNLVSLTTPVEGEAVSGSVKVTGVANSNEANVLLSLERLDGSEVGQPQPATAEGWMGNKLFPFEGAFDLTGVPAGEYVLVARTDDPSGGAEGFGAHEDSKTIIVK